jgi:hypothetical protein
VRSDGTLIAGQYFWNVDPFFDGVAGVQTAKDSFGIIDQNGDFILAPMRIKVRIFSTGHNRTGFESSGGRVLIDRRVAEALAKDPSPLLWKGRPVCRDDGVSIVESDVSFTYNDMEGKPLIEGKFDFATCFHKGVAWVAISDRQEWCQITKSGAILQDTCRCSQPLIIIEIWARPRPRPKGLSCYGYGLKIVRDSDRRHKIQ